MADGWRSSDLVRRVDWADVTRQALLDNRGCAREAVMRVGRFIAVSIVG